MFRPLTEDGPVRGLHWLAVTNGAGETAPAHALVRVTGGGKTGPYAGAKPDADGGYAWVLSGEDTPAGSVGAAAVHGPVWALYDAADGTPAVGDTWGAGAGTWKLRKDRPGFRVAGDPDSALGIVPVVWAAGSGGALTVEEQDGAPSVPDVVTLQFDQGAGLAVRDQGDGVALVTLETPTGAAGPDCSWLSAAVEDDCFEYFTGPDPEPLPGTITIDGEELPIVFDPAVPSLTISGIAGVVAYCACPCVTFTFRRADFYAGEEPAPSICDRVFRVKVCQTCCPIDGWAGAGWYCVRDAGTDDPGVPGELLPEDKCDDTIEIVSGPYESEAAALAVCGPPPTCTDVPPNSLPTDLNWVVTGATGAATCAIGLSGTIRDYGFAAPQRVWEQTSYFNPCSEFTQGLNVRCEGGVYKIGAITAYGGCPGTGGPKYEATAGSASPFKLIFTVPACWFRDATANPADTVTVEVTA